VLYSRGKGEVTVVDQIAYKPVQVQGITSDRLQTGCERDCSQKQAWGNLGGKVPLPSGDLLQFIIPILQ